MAKFSESVINQIKARTTITDVVSSYVTLSRKGDRLWGLCPFHNEKTPSFSVVEDKGFYKCFGCGKGGSMFDFVMEIEHVSFPEAVELLAKKTGVQLKEETDAEKKRRSFEETLLNLYEKLSSAFHYILLNAPEASKAREYLEKRRITKESQERFLLGYAPADTDWLYGFLIKNHYSPEFLARSGLFSARNGKWPLFADRIMFPIRTWQGNCVAFGGRDLSGTSRAKYINTPETELYSKKNLLFGLYEGLAAIKNRKSVIICEGNFDVISMQQSGMENTVAPLGTAFTPEQAKLLRRYCEKATLLFDSDAAGQNAVYKGIIRCQEFGLESSVINLGSDKDPSEALEKEGPEALAESCANLSNGFDYLVHLALKRYDVRQPKAKFLVFKEVRPFLEATASEIERQGYIKKLADILNVSEQRILEDYQSGGDIRREKTAEIEATNTKASDIKMDSDMYLMLLLANNRGLFEKFKSSFKIGLIRNDDAMSVYAALEDAQRLGYKTDEVMLQLIGSDSLREVVRESFSSDMYKDKDADKHIAESIKLAQIRDLEEKRASVLGVLKINSQTNGSESDLELLSQIQDLDRRIQELKTSIACNEDV
ncbi:MAG: DNA primase [Sphaerochaetaceae bacterium]